MALTVTYTEQGADRQKLLHKLVDSPRGEGWRLVTGQLSLDNSYPTGGYPLDLTGLIPNVVAVLIETKAGYVFEYDDTNRKVKVMRFDYPNAAQGPAVEVPNATDLSALTGIRFLAFGY